MTNVCYFLRYICFSFKIIFSFSNKPMSVWPGHLRCLIPTTEGPGSALAWWECVGFSDGF